jgi:GNAT superfamily N-acetyltransferase
MVETFEIINLEGRHLAGALALSEEAHWNQVEADWKMMMAAGEAIGIEESDGRLVASALALPCGKQFGWVSMVLVTEACRKKGLATQLLSACIQNLENAGMFPVLDATPAGENVYRPMGFLPHFGFQRWEHEDVGGISIEGITGSKFMSAETDAIAQLDVEIFGGERPKVLKNLLGRSATLSCMDNKKDGFLLGRDGRMATQIGPIFSNKIASAINMLDFALLQLTGRVFIDACDHQTDFITRLEQYGFKRQRPFLRMAKGRVENLGDPSRMFAMAGPELG